MGGIDLEAIPSALNIPDDYTVEIGMAIGRPGPVESLPEKMRGREVPNTRRPITDFIANGKFAW